MDLVCYVISKNQVIKQSSHALGRCPSNQFTIAPLVVIMGNNALSLSSGLTRPPDHSSMLFYGCGSAVIIHHSTQFGGH